MTAPRRPLEAPHRRDARTGGRSWRPIEKAAVLAYRTTAWLLGHLPAGPLAVIAGRLFQLSYLIWPAKRRSSDANFAHVLGCGQGDPAVRRLALAAYGTYARYLVELMRLPSLRPDELDGIVEGDGRDQVLDVWRRSGKGLILTAGHVGSNEAVAAGIARHGIPIAAVADDSAFPELFDLLKRQRESWGLLIIPWRNLRELFGVLKRREILALLVDWGYRSDGIPVQFFGAWTCLPAGPAALAAKSGAPILPIAIRRTPYGRYVVTTDEPIFVPSSHPADLQRATQAYASALERTITAAPEQWYSFRPQWPATAEESAQLERRAAAMLAGAPGRGGEVSDAPGEDAVVAPGPASAGALAQP